MFGEEDLIPISALQHWVFCPRQCGLIHLEDAWSENLLTAQGRLLHEKAHQGGPERRGNLRIERGVGLRSLALGITGVADVVEFHQEGKHWLPFPVEYKRGRPKPHAADRVQLAAQAACLEEMTGLPAPAGALFYGAARRREVVEFTPELKETLAQAVQQVRAMLCKGKTPPPCPGRHCKNCSLKTSCLPDRSTQPEAARRYLARQIAASLEEP